MLTVHNGELMVEEKGIYSIENSGGQKVFMYWQVYLHKTVLSAEQNAAAHHTRQGNRGSLPELLHAFIQN